jgi:hypothetical protein
VLAFRKFERIPILYDDWFLPGLPLPQWFASRIREEVLFRDWVENFRELHQAACDESAEWGKKENLWMSNLLAGEGAEDVRSCCGLLRALETDAICFKAAKDIAAGSDGAAALEAGDAQRTQTGEGGPMGPRDADTSKKNSSR